MKRACPITLSTGNVCLYGSHYDASALSAYILTSGNIVCPHDETITFTMDDLALIDSVAGKGTVKFVRDGKHSVKKMELEKDMNERKFNEFLEHEIISNMENGNVAVSISILGELRSRDNASWATMKAKVEKYPVYKEFTQEKTSVTSRRMEVVDEDTVQDAQS